MKFELKKKKTFFSNGGVCIYRKSIYKPKFYCVSKSGGFLFNLPEGNYKFMEGNFNDSKYNLEYDIKLLPYNYDETPPEDFKVKFARVDTKAIIYRKLQLIVIDNIFLKMPQYVAKFLYEHEKGHYYYLKKNDFDSIEIEKNCDLKAAKEMLILGYNPSQIYAAIQILGTGKIAMERINYVKHNIISDEIEKRYI